jgi:SAM-dependent methyltransferase
VKNSQEGSSSTIPVTTRLPMGLGASCETMQPRSGEILRRRPDASVFKEMLASLCAQYGSSLRVEALAAQASQLFRICRLYQEGGVLVDLGGGISAHNGILAQLGMKVHVVDMLGDYWAHRDWLPGGAASAEINHEFELLESCGVRFSQGEVTTYDFTKHFSENSLDFVTSFHCLEHLHHSPKMPMESAMRVLKPGGTLIIEVPNAANLRKRLALLMGRSNYEPYNWFYNNVPWLGHVREYTTGDLRQLARNLGAREYQIYGKNFLQGPAVQHVSKYIPRPFFRFFDAALQLFPSLCSCIFLEVRKRIL